METLEKLCVKSLIKNHIPLFAINNPAIEEQLINLYQRPIKIKYFEDICKDKNISSMKLKLFFETLDIVWDDGSDPIKNKKMCDIEMEVADKCLKFFEFTCKINSNHYTDDTYRIKDELIEKLYDEAVIIIKILKSRHMHLSGQYESRIKYILTTYQENLPDHWYQSRWDNAKDRDIDNDSKIFRYECKSGKKIKSFIDI